MLPEITNALQFMGVIIMLLTVAIAIVGVIAIRLRQDVRALYEHLQLLDQTITADFRRGSDLADLVGELSRQVTDLEFIANVDI